HRMSDRILDALSRHARERVSDPAGRIRHDDANNSAWKRLSGGAGGEQAQSHQRGEPGRQFAAGAPPWHVDFRLSRGINAGSIASRPIDVAPARKFTLQLG